MQIQTSVGSVVGNNSSLHWVQTIKTPQVFGIVEAVDEAGIAQTIGMQAIGRIAKKLEYAPISLHELELVGQEGMHEGIHSIVLVAVVGMVVYIVIRGSGKVLLKRNGQYAKLLDDEGSISGQIQIGDVFILTSGACTHIIDEYELLSVLAHSSVTEAADQIGVMVNKESDSAGCAAMVMGIDAMISDTQQKRFLDTKVGLVVHKIQAYSDPSRIHRFVRSPLQEKIASVKRHILQWRHRLKNPKISITMILLVCFGVSILVGIHKELLTKTDVRVTSVMTEAQRMYEEGTALMSLNPVKGRERLVSAKTTMETITGTVTNKTKEGRRVLELYAQITDAVTQAKHAYEEEPQLFYDASLMKSDGAVSMMAIETDTIILGDTHQKAVYSVTLPAKTGSIIGGGMGYETMQSVTIHGKIGYALLNDGVNSIDIGQKTTKQNSIKRTDDWGTITAMSSFGGNIYLLDTQKSRIWKYVATDSGFSDIREYLNPDTLPDLSKSTSMVIDGSVWIGTTDGRILRFTQGKENVFTPKGVDPAFGARVAVYTSDETNNVYVLDSDQKRVVVLDKDGMYLSQYIWKSMITFTNLVVSEKHGKILLLGSEKVYSIDIH